MAALANMPPVRAWAAWRRCSRCSVAGCRRRLPAGCRRRSQCSLDHQPVISSRRRRILVRYQTTVTIDEIDAGLRTGAVPFRPMSRLDRITSDPRVCHGQPTVRGLRYPVEMLLELLASGMTNDEVLADYPNLEADDLLAALEYGALTAGARQVIPLRAG